MKSKNKAGLDIGSFAIKIIEISLAADKPALVGFGIKNIADTAKKDLPNCIRELALKSHISAKEFNISVSGPSVIVRFISMPKMKDEDLKSAVKFEAEKFIAFNINDCILDFQILNKEAKENKMDVLLVAAKKEHVLEKIKLTEDAGFMVRAVDVDAFALANSFLRNFPNSDADRSLALLNIGAAHTNLSILKGNTIFFARDMTLGCLDTKNILNSLLDEIRLSFTYYENQSGKGIDEIFLSGGGATIVGLHEALQDAFGSKPAVWNPLSFLKATSTDVDKVKNSFAVAAGLALR